MKKLLLLLLSCIATHATDTVLVITHAFNRPSFIELHYTTFKHFFTDPYEYVVFNDATDERMVREIEHTCAKLAIRCIRVPQQQVHARHRQHDCERVSDVIQYSLDLIGFDYDGIVAIIDSDIFPIKKFSFTCAMKNYDLFGRIWHPGNNPKITYLWNGLLFMDMRTLPDKRSMNFDCGRVDGYPVDTAGQLHYYIKDHPELNINYYVAAVFNDEVSRGTLLIHDYAWLKHQQGYEDFLINFIMRYKGDMEIHADGAFIHYRAGGNWQRLPASYHQEKERILMALIDQALQQ